MKNKQQQHKQQVAEAALSYVKPGCVLGVGTGSTVGYFIDGLARVKGHIEVAIPSSEATKQLLLAQGIPVGELNHVRSVDVYIDGADECNAYKTLIKGGGAALTREKIIANASQQFVCMIDASKKVNRLGKFPLPVEVIPMARSFVARELVRMGGSPEYREGVVTDNGNVILDVYQFNMDEAVETERRINDIPGVVCNGLFALRGADVVLVGDGGGVAVID